MKHDAELGCGAVVLGQPGAELGLGLEIARLHRLN